MKKRIFALTMLILLLSALQLPAFAVAEPTEDFYVADYAGVLSPKLEQLICDYNGALETQCDGAQFVVLTVNYLDGKYADEYCAEVFSAWGIGSQEQNNGVLLLLGVQENKFWLMPGYGLQNDMDEKVVNSILDDAFADNFDSGNYEAAVESALYAVLGWFDAQYGTQVVASNPNLDDYGYTPDHDRNHDYNGWSPNPIRPYISLYSIAKVVIVIVIIVAVLGSIGKNGRGGRGGGGGGGGGFWPWFFIGNAFGRRSGWTHSHRPPHEPPSGGRGGHSHRGGGGFGGGHGGGGFGGGFGRGGGGFGGGGGGGRR